MDLDAQLVGECFGILQRFDQSREQVSIVSGQLSSVWVAVTWESTYTSYEQS